MGKLPVFDLQGILGKHLNKGGASSEYHLTGKALILLRQPIRGKGP
jgi:hypothetical protein